MKPHAKAWQAIQPALFGSVCEITSKPNWGFKKDREDIKNVTVEEFLETPFFSDTILLHILAGEGVSLPLIQDLVRVAYNNCVKLVVLEHNPESSDWSDNTSVTDARVQFLLDILGLYGDTVVADDLGRNLVFEMTTLHPLDIPELSDAFYAEEIDKKYLRRGEGMDVLNRVYVATSELPLPDEHLQRIPEDLRCTWVIGGQWYLETIPKLPNNKHHLVDSVLLQTIYARYIIEDDREDSVFIRKMSSLFSVDELKRMADAPPHARMVGKGGWQWRNIIKDRSKYKGIKNQIRSIRLRDVTRLHLKGELVYTSTVEYSSLSEDLLKNNYIVSAAFPELPRNYPVLRSPDDLR
jgi:hypothetical protein